MEVDSGTVNLVSSMVYVSVLVPVSSEGVRRLVVVAAVALDCSGGRIGHDDRLDCLPLLLLQWTGLTEAVRCDAASLCSTTGMRSCSSLSFDGIGMFEFQMYFVSGMGERGGGPVSACLQWVLIGVIVGHTGRRAELQIGRAVVGGLI